MSPTFKTVALVAKCADPGVIPTLKLLADELTRRGVRPLLDEAAACYFEKDLLPTASRNELAERCDLAIVVGGDGTLLNAARSFAEPGVPVLGVNLGRLGFLADVSPEEIPERLDEILSGRFEEERRSLLHATVVRGEQVVSESDALNDVVVHKWDIARMIEVETWIDAQFLHALRADGLIVSTPTGSTAYALSGGGPILEPALNALVLVPICPHTLSNRPIVVSDEVEIEILLHGSDATQAQITCDGQINFGLIGGDRVRISRKDHALRLIHPQGHSHFDIMRRKLRWAEQP